MMQDYYKKVRLYGWRQSLWFGCKEIGFICRNFLRHSYSQYAEDLIIDKYTGYKKHGFYVDIGAYDPNRFSNTKRFYQRGWNGINVEPNPKRYEKFIHERPRDINLNIGITDAENAESSQALFHEFFPDTLSTFSNQVAKEYQLKGHQCIRSIEVQVDTLTHIFERYAANTHIDFLSIDTEGFDLIVLKSNDWKRFRPTVICIEQGEYQPSPLERQSEVSTSGNEGLFLESVGYMKVYNNQVNSIYVSR